MAYTETVTFRIEYTEETTTVTALVQDGKACGAYEWSVTMDWEPSEHEAVKNFIGSLWHGKKLHRDMNGQD